ncbi:MAG: hypothetical protein EAX91_10450 [Candidatus Lokiarchaeota archaeon]|nr:hypothetical protein [Candidatus Lokiarchaeota archaeon]
MVKEDINVEVRDDRNPPASSCCENSTVEKKAEIGSLELSEEKTKDNNKLYVDVYVPLNACECVWSQFMNLVFTALAPYMKYIKFETKNLDSEEAHKLNLTGNCVVVDGKKKFITSFALKKELPNLLKEKGLL